MPKILQQSAEWWPKITQHARTLVDFFIHAMQPPSRVPIWQWLEANYELIQGKSALPGKIDFSPFPASKAFFNHAQDYRCRQISEMVCAQSGKTENAMMLFCYRVVENPKPAMWVMANADQCEEFAKDRMYYAIEKCQPTFELAPTDRERWTRKMIQFDTATLHLRGSNSKGKLKSSPIGHIYCDERMDWKHGAIHTLRKRLTTFSDAQEVSMGTPGVKDDEWHTDWKEGSQTFFYFTCLTCGHSQPFRFGRTASVLFPKPRLAGGIVWPKNLKGADGWDYVGVERAAKYECEKCVRLYDNGEKVELLKTVEECHRNPDALPRHYSSSRNVLMMPWASCSFGKIAVRFLKAKAALNTGDLEPMITFVQEDLGEPWEPLASYKQKEDLLERMGDYSLGEYWSDPLHPDQLEKDTGLILTADRQLMYLRVIIRQWRRKGGSRLVHVFDVASLDDLRARQLELKIKDTAVWLDDGGTNTAEFRQKCLLWRWNILKGEDFDHFVIQYREKENGESVAKSVRQGWRETMFDPGIGTTLQGRTKIAATLWSNPWFKDRLYFFFMRGLGPLWEIAKDVPQYYLDEMTANKWTEKVNAHGVKESFFSSGGNPDHCADAELMQLVVADRAGFTRSLAKPIQQPTENKNENKN